MPGRAGLDRLALVVWLLGRAMRTGPPRPVATAERLANIPLSAAGLRAPVRIQWDAHQVPSVEAANDHDLAFGLGVVHAHLRLAQMEAMRRLATGRVAEVVGPAGVEIDRALRLMRFGEAVPAMQASLPAGTREWAEGFVSGINHQIAGAPALPYEFRLLGRSPEPWTLQDLLMVSRLAATDVSWLVFARLLRGRARLTTAAWDALWPLLQQGDRPAPPSGVAEAALGLVRGSNSAAVSGSRSAGGAGMIASDPHLAITLPPLWLIAGLHAPGLDVVGLMIPGLPVVALGRSDRLAWGGTNLHAASSELIDAAGEPTHARRETIAVRGRPSVQVTLRETRFGPLVSDGMLLRGGQDLALRWVGHAPSDEMTAMLQAMRAGSLAEFRAALRSFAVPGQTMVAVEAGPAGRSGRAIAAHLPRRANAPLPGLVCSPASAWRLDDLLIAADLPQPDEDVVVSANDRPQATPVPVGFFFSPPDRARRLRALLDTGAKVSFAAMRAVQLDIHQESALALRDALLPRLDPGRREAAAGAALAAWDGLYDAASAGALVFEVLIGSLARRLLPRGDLELMSGLWSGRTLIARRIDAVTAPVLAAALRDAARALRRYRSWGAAHFIRLRHPLAALPLAGRWFAGAEFPANGGSDTLNKTGHGLVTGRHSTTYGACARHASDLAEPDANWFVLLGGQDGWLGSANAADQVPLWRAGKAIQVPLRATAAHAWPHCTVLTPL